METIKVNTFADYQTAAMRTCTESAENLEYLTLEIVSEAGEVAGKIAKLYRDDNGELTEARREEIAKELGDVMWGIAGLLTISGKTFDDVAHKEIDKYGEELSAAEEDLPLDAMRLTLAAANLVNWRYQFDASTRIWLEYVKTTMVEIAAIAKHIGSNMQTICQKNIDKLTDRYNRNQIHGSGDER